MHGSRIDLALWTFPSFLYWSFATSAQMSFRTMLPLGDLVENDPNFTWWPVAVWSFPSFCDCLTAVCLQCPAFVCMFSFPPWLALCWLGNTAYQYFPQEIYTLQAFYFFWRGGGDRFYPKYLEKGCMWTVCVYHGGRFTALNHVNHSVSLSLLFHILLVLHPYDTFYSIALLGY